MDAAPPEQTTLELLGGGVVLTVPAGHVAELALVRLRLTRPEASPPDGARAAVVHHTPGPPRTSTTLAFVAIMRGGGAAFAEAAAMPGPIAGPATLVCETDADPTWPCRVVVRTRWRPAEEPACRS